MYPVCTSRWPQSIPTIYGHVGRDNRSMLVLYRSLYPHKQRTDLTSVTAMHLSFCIYNDPAVTIDSAVDRGVFDWRSRGHEGYLYISLGEWHVPSTFDLVAQVGDLIVFDPVYRDGLVWGQLRVVWVGCQSL